MSIAELLIYLVQALTSFILRFYNFARSLIAKLQKNVIFTPVFDPIIGITDQNSIADGYILIAYYFSHYVLALLHIICLLIFI